MLILSGKLRPELLLKPLKKIFHYSKKTRPIHIGVGIFVLFLGVSIGRTQMPLAVKVASFDAIPVDGPLSVRFGQDVAPGYLPSIDPEIPGQWQVNRSPLGVSEAVFKPKDLLDPGRTYKLRFTGLRRTIFGQKLSDIEVSVTAEIAEGIKSITPANNSVDVKTDTPLRVNMSDPNKDTSHYAAKLSGIDLRQVAQGQSPAWEAGTPLKQGVTYTLSIEDTSQAAEKRGIISSTFTTVKPPKILKATSGDHFAKDQTVDITFDQPMDTSSNEFTFGLAGQGSWLDDKTYRFKPASVEPGKSYVYRVKAGLRTKVGGKFEADAEYKFDTNGKVTASLSPGGTVGPNTPMSVTFDQEVDRGSAEQRFSISPKLTGKFVWSGKTMIFTPAGADYQTSYTFAVAAGVKPKWGLESAQAFSRAYTTTTQVVRLNVPLYAQGGGRTCEVASLRMALAGKGVFTSESAILGRLGYNPRARSGDSWDNPNVMFVGYSNTYSWSQGYGVHAGPLASAGSGLGRSSSAHFGVSSAFISQQIHAGYPVVVYGHISAPRADSWSTSSGTVSTTTSMHARVVYGVVGSKSNPSGFYVHDPWAGGSSYFWSASSLMANMNAVPGISNQAVVVR